MFNVGSRRRVAVVATYVLAHVHDPDHCQVAYAAWRGFDSPLRGQRTIASCGSGDHRMFWTVQADNAEAALAQLPPYLAQRTHVSKVSEVPIRSSARAGRAALASLLGLAMLVPGAGAAGTGVDVSSSEGQLFSGNVVSGLTCPLASAMITWGDAPTTSAGTSDGSTGIQGSHTYAEEGTYTGSVSYIYQQPAQFRCTAGIQTATFQATVQDAPLTATGVNISGTAGQSLTVVVGHVNDGNPIAGAGDFTAQIMWGDGSSMSGSVTPVAGGFDVTGTHTYATAGTYPVNTSIADAGGAVASSTSSAQIVAPAAQPPRSVDAPVLSGSPHETDTLTTTSGFWSGSPTGYQYQWLRCATPSGGSCAVVAGATASTYTVAHEDVGSTMRSRVRAGNAVGTSLPADSAPTAAVKPLVLTARLTVMPNPTCTGVRVSFDASASQTPNPPIERYRITEEAGVGDDPTAPFHTPRPAPWVVLDGTSPRATELPTYDTHWDDPVPFYPPLSGLWQATNRTITLTVRDRAGTSASSTQVLFFAAGLSSQSRATCPPMAHGISGDLVLHDVKLQATNQALLAKIRCPTITDCAGTLEIDRAFSRIRRNVKPVVIARSGFYVTGHRGATITTQLTRSGRSLLSHGQPLAALARLTTVSPTGRTIKQAVKVSLIVKRTRR